MKPFELRIHKSINPMYDVGLMGNWNDAALTPYLESALNESVLVADSYQIAAYNKLHLKEPLNILDEVIVESYGLFNLKMDYPIILPILGKFGKKLRENGLLDRIISKWIDLKMMKPPPQESEPMVLTLDHLGIGFKLYAIAISLAMIGFISEVLLMFYIKARLVQVVVEQFLRRELKAH